MLQYGYGTIFECYPKAYIFKIVFFGRQSLTKKKLRDREGDLLSTVLHPSGLSCQGYVRLRIKPRPSIQISLVYGRSQVSDQLLLLSQMYSQGAGLEVDQPALKLALQ